MSKVHPQEEHGADIGEDDDRLLEFLEHQLVEVPNFFPVEHRGVLGAELEVLDMEDQEDQQQDSGKRHGSRRERSARWPARGSRHRIALGPRLAAPIPDVEAGNGMRGEEHDEPEIRDDHEPSVEQAVQEAGVGVEGLLSEQQGQIAREVPQR